MSGHPSSESAYMAHSIEASLALLSGGGGLLVEHCLQFDQITLSLQGPELPNPPPEEIDLLLRISEADMPVLGTHAVDIIRSGMRQMQKACDGTSKCKEAYHFVNWLPGHKGEMSLP